MKAPVDYKCKSVMIVDDNDIDRYIAKKVISQYQFCDEVMSYGNPLEALEYLQDNQKNISELPNIIFLDIYMPEMSGFEFMEVFRQFPDTLKKQCTVYIVSSTIDPNDLIRVENDHNIKALCVKPINGNFLAQISKKLN